MKIETKAELQELLRTEFAGIVAENPQLVLDAMAKNPEALRASFAAAGFIIGDKAAEGSTRAVMTSYREGQAEGTIASGFGSRVRKAVRSHARRVLDEDTGRQRTTFLDETTEPMVESWFRAFLNAKAGAGAVDPETNEHIGTIRDRLNKATRAVTVPMTMEAGTGGGFLLPLLVAAEVFEYMNERFLLRGMVEVFVSSGPLQIPRRLSQVTVSRMAPAATTVEKNVAATLGSVKLSPELVGAVTYIDPRLALAAAVGPVRWIIGQLAEAMAKDYQRTIIAGNQLLREPMGISSIPTAGAAAADMMQTATYTGTSNQTKRDSIRTLYYQIAQPHRESSRFVWIASNAGVQVMASVNDLNQAPFKDAVNGQPATYMGKTLVESTAVTVSSLTSTLYCGDMGQYAWLESPEGLSLQQTDVGGDAWLTNTIGIKIVQSVDGAPVIPQAFGSMASMV